MTSIGEMTAQAATLLGINHGTMAKAVRTLRDAGLLSTGARGVNAPHMTPRDGAVLLLAALATERPTYAAKAATRLGSLKGNLKLDATGSPLAAGTLLDEIGLLLHRVSQLDASELDIAQRRCGLTIRVEIDEASLDIEDGSTILFDAHGAWDAALRINTGNELPGDDLVLQKVKRLPRPAILTDRRLSGDAIVSFAQGFRDTAEKKAAA